MKLAWRLYYKWDGIWNNEEPLVPFLAMIWIAALIFMIMACTFQVTMPPNPELAQLESDRRTYHNYAAIADGQAYQKRGIKP